MNKIIGYVRTSTNRQDLGLEFQLAELAKLNPTHIYHEQISGRKTDRPELIKALAAVERGDTLLVYKLDRLGRSVKQLATIISDLNARGVKFRSIHDNLDTGTINGRLMFNMLSTIAEFEADLISERTKDALKMTTKRLGPPRRISDDQRMKIVQAYQFPEVRVVDIAHQYHISTDYVYKLAKNAGVSRKLAKGDVANV